MPLSKGRSTPNPPKCSVREGWVHIAKVKKGLFSRANEGEEIHKTWLVLAVNDSNSLEMSFYSTKNRSDKLGKSLKISLESKKDKVGLFRISGHPKHPHTFAIKCKERKLRFIASSKGDMLLWLDDLSKLLKIHCRIEKIMWEWNDETGLWQPFPEDTNKELERNHFDHKFQFELGNSYHYNLTQMTRVHVRSKKNQKLRRNVVHWEKPEVVREKLKDLPVIWEWLNWEEEWYPYTRTVNTQIEELFQSEGAKWMEVVVDLPSPTPVLLDLHHQRQVNLTTGARWPIRRLESAVRDKVPLPSCMHHYEILEEDSATIESDDEVSSSTFKSSGNGTSGLGNRMLMSDDFMKIQVDLKKLQIPRDNIVKFLRELGEGQFGKVHLDEAVHIPRVGNTDALQVACKQLRLSDHPVHHNQQIMDFLREAKEMAKFDHPRVVKLLAVCTMDFPLLILTEYMNKGDLLGVLQDCRPHMDLHLQMRFAAEVAEGMLYLSTEMDCVHRDLAARNIMIHEDTTGEMHAKIADFGLSRHVYSGIYAPTSIKKARPLPAKWMALESLIDFVFTTKSDIWSYGVLLWEIMTLGRNPYPGIDNRDLLEQIEEKGLKLSRPKKCPEAVFDVIMKCTSHEPNKRPNFGSLWKLCSQFESDAREGRLTHVDPKARSAATPVKKPLAPPIPNVDVNTRDDFPTPPESEVNTVDDSSSNEKQIEDKQQQLQQQPQTVSSELEKQPDKACEQSEPCQQGQQQPPLSSGLHEKQKSTTLEGSELCPQQKQQQPISNQVLDKRQDIPHERNELCQQQQQQQHGMYKQQHLLVNGQQEEARESNPYGRQQQNLCASELNCQQQQQQRELDELKGQHYEDGCDKPPPAQNQQLECCQPSSDSSVTVSNESRDSGIKDRTLPSKGLYHGNNVNHSSSNECIHPGSLSVL